jgi:hypothetical protein
MWPTATATDCEQAGGPNANHVTLNRAGTMWMTPNVPNGGRTMPAELVASKGMTVGGQKRTVDLGSQVTHWATPKANDSEKRGNVAHRPHMPELVGQAQAWPTPKGTDGTKGGPNQAGSKGDLMLPSAAAQWPTPVANDDNKSPEAHLAMKARMKGGPRQTITSLQVLVQQWPTPAARDSKGANSAEHALITGGGRKHMDQLSNFVAHSSHLAQPMPDGPPSCESGQDSPPPSAKRLNPAFGEWLMGWPIGHTIAEPSASSASEMASWRCKLRQRLSYLFAE